MGGASSKKSYNKDEVKEMNMKNFSTKHADNTKNLKYVCDEIQNEVLDFSEIIYDHMKIISNDIKTYDESKFDKIKNHLNILKLLMKFFTDYIFTKEEKEIAEKKKITNLSYNSLEDFDKWLKGEYDNIVFWNFRWYLSYKQNKHIIDFDDKISYIKDSKEKIKTELINYNTNIINYEETIKNLEKILNVLNIIILNTHVRHFGKQIIYEIECDQKFFEGSYDGVSGWFSYYLGGLFSWMGRSGYGFKDTSEFYKSYIRNIIRPMINDNNNYFKNFIEATKYVNDIIIKFDSYNIIIKENYTDSINFSINNEERMISIGNNYLKSYLSLCQKINCKIRESNIPINFMLILGCNCKANNKNKCEMCYIRNKYNFDGNRLLFVTDTNINLKILKDKTSMRSFIGLKAIDYECNRKSKMIIVELKCEDNYKIKIEDENNANSVVNKSEKDNKKEIVIKNDTIKIPIVLDSKLYKTEVYKIILKENNESVNIISKYVESVNSILTFKAINNSKIECSLNELKEIIIETVENNFVYTELSLAVDKLEQIKNDTVTKNFNDIEVLTTSYLSKMNKPKYMLKHNIPSE